MTMLLFVKYFEFLFILQLHFLINFFLNQWNEISTFFCNNFSYLLHDRIEFLFYRRKGIAVYQLYTRLILYCFKSLSIDRDS